MSAASAASRESGLVTDSTTRTREFCTDVLRVSRMRHNVIASANMLDPDVRRGGFRVDPVLVTLTYRGIDDPEPCHVRDYLTLCRKWLKRRGEHFRYVWTAELQERGALHYHVVLWLPHGIKLPKPDKSGWWPHGWSRIERARNGPGYIAKYASKLRSKLTDTDIKFPRGFRMYGVGGLDCEDRLKRAWTNLPGWLRERVVPEDRAKRIRGGGWIERLSGAFWPSPFKLVGFKRVAGRSYVSIASALPEGLELCSPW